MKNIDIKEMSSNKWKEIRCDLEKDLKEIDWRGKIIRVSNNSIQIIGGRIPVGFNLEKLKTYVWSKCSKYSSCTVEINKLIEIQKVLHKWANKWF